MKRRLLVIAAAGLATLLTGLAPVAQAYTTADGFSAADYVTGFDQSKGSAWGPIGIAFDQSDNLYVGDLADGYIYRFEPGGGDATAASRLNRTSISGAITGLAFTRSGSLYVARYRTGDVVQVDPQTGAIMRTVASVPCATGLAVDPLTGDLFASQNQCGSTVFRISGVDGTSPSISPYAHAAGVDGLAFDQSGTLYAESDGNVLEIQGTNSQAPGAVSSIARVPHGDGVAFGAHQSGTPPFLVVNGNDGQVTEVDFGQNPPAQSAIFTGGSRGDFAAVDSHGCLYITQSSAIVKITPAGAQCAFEPSTPGAGSGSPAVVVTQLSSSTQPSGPVGAPGPSTSPGAKPGKPSTGGGKSGGGSSCNLNRNLTLRLSQRGRVRLSSATVYVNGRRVARLRGAATQAPFVLRHLPGASFTLTVVAMTTKGRRLVTRRQYSSLCAPKQPPAPRCVKAGKLKLSVPQRRGARATAVTIYVNGRRTVARGHRLTSVTVSSLSNTFTVKLVVRYSSGASTTVRLSIHGCPAVKRGR